MFCGHCGKEVEYGSAFCINCGAKIQSDTTPRNDYGPNDNVGVEHNWAAAERNTETKYTPPEFIGYESDGGSQKKRKGSRPRASKSGGGKRITVVMSVAAVALAAILILQNIGVIGLFLPQKYEGSGYASAEDAALAYLEALKAGDFEAAAGTFAIETAVENVDTEAFLERIRSYSINTYDSYPLTINGTEEERQLLTMLRYGNIVDSIFTQMLDYDGLMNNGLPITFSSDDAESEIREFLSDNYGSDYFEDMSNVEFVGFYSLRALYDDYYSESNQNIIERMRVCYGADALEEVAMHIVLGGEDYLYCLLCAEYDGKWYVLDFSGNISALLAISAYQNGLISFDEAGID